MGKAKIKKQVIDAFSFRHACKIFDPRKTIAEKHFTYLLETVRLSPSSFGFEPWHVLVLQDMDIRKKLMSAVWGAQRQLPTCSHYIALLARKKPFMQYDSDYIKYMMHEVQHLPNDKIQSKREHYQAFQESDFDIMDERAMFDWACRQCYIALGNMMSAAAMIGIDSCAVEGFSQNEVERILEKQKLLDTQYFGVACMVAFGYRVTEPKAKTRKTLEQIVTFVE